MPTSSQSTITSQQNITFNGLSLGSTNVTYDHTFLTFDSFFFFFLMTDDAQNSQWVNHPDAQWQGVPEKWKVKKLQKVPVGY